MKTAWLGVLVLVAACALSAQEPNNAAIATNGAAAFSDTSAAQTKLFVTNGDDSAAPSVSRSNNLGDADADAASLPAPAPPPAKPKLIFGERDDYRFQLGVGFEYMRFQSKVFNANLLGLNTSFAYFTNSWFGLEADVPVGFSPSTFNGFHPKIVGGLGGFRIGSRRAKWEPWGHGLIGGSHLQPQTAAGGRTALMAMAGAGLDYRVHSRLSFRFEGDWVYTGYFSQAQNNFQGVAGVVLHF